MTVKELIDILQDLPPNAVVVHEVAGGFIEEADHLPVAAAYLAGGSMTPRDLKLRGIKPESVVIE